MPTLTPAATPARLCELSVDVRTAVLLDAAGALVACSDLDAARANTLAASTRALLEAVDKVPGEPVEQVEVQVPGGAVYASRSPRWTLAVVARRNALSSLMLCDLRAVLGELEGGAPIRRVSPGRGAAAA
ncbi:MAG TPA: roadblock/LC7 domain-containing protein [Thermoleophilaceae bacterium]